MTGMQRSAAVVAAVVVGGCGGRAANQAIGIEISTAICAPTNVFTSNITNRFFPLPVGQTAVFEGGGERVEVTSLDETEVVAGVICRVVHEYETKGGELVEQSWNYFAQTEDGTVCYFGERVDIYDKGKVVAHDGQWRADDNGFAPGIQMPGEPMAGTYHAQEYAPGVAEDYANIIATGQTVTVPYGTFTDTVITSEWTPLEPGDLSPKSYAAGVGLLDDNGAKLTSIGSQP